MRFLPTPIEGAYLIEPDPHVDDRGSFARAFCGRELAEAGISFEVCQINIARTRRAGTVRGLHYQLDPPEQKIVRCVAGAVLDAIVDVRPGSPTHRAVFHVELDPLSQRSLLVPAGVAHGFQALVDDTDFLYLSDQYHVPGRDHGVRYSDPAIGVPWPVPPRDITSRDETWPLLDQLA